MKKYINTISALVLITILSGASIVQAEPNNKSLASILIEAIRADNYEAYIANGDDAFKRMPEATFKQVAGQLGPRLVNGFELTYLGVTKRQKHNIQVWNISYHDGGDDSMILLSEEGGKVLGFFIQ